MEKYGKNYAKLACRDDRKPYLSVNVQNVVFSNFFSYKSIFAKLQIIS